MSVHYVTLIVTLSPTGDLIINNDSWSDHVSIPKGSVCLDTGLHEVKVAVGANHLKVVHNDGTFFLFDSDSGASKLLHDFLLKEALSGFEDADFLASVTRK